MILSDLKLGETEGVMREQGDLITSFMTLVRALTAAHIILPINI